LEKKKKTKQNKTKKTSSKIERIAGETQVEGPEYKPQYQQKKSKLF
jgi:hypothetical protein